MVEVSMRERKKEATKTNILKAALELINEHGFSSTTMQLIAEKADVALRTLYNYFPSKETIVATYLQMAVEEEQEKSWAEVMELGATYERLILFCQKSMEWIKENPVLVEVYTVDPRNYIFSTGPADIPRSGLEELVAKLMEMGQQMGDVTKSVPVKVLTRQFLGFYHFSILTWLCDNKQDLFKIFKEGLDLFWGGVKTKTVDPGTVLWGMFG
ncbi:MAG: TetR/AcrR family transcriptional regulator [Eubacteriales bacterium]